MIHDLHRKNYVSVGVIIKTIRTFESEVFLSASKINTAI